MADMQLARRAITSRCHEGNKAWLDSYVGADNWLAVAACIGRAYRKADGGRRPRFGERRAVMLMSAVACLRLPDGGGLAGLQCNQQQPGFAVPITRRRYRARTLRQAATWRKVQVFVSLDARDQLDWLVQLIEVTARAVEVKQSGKALKAANDRPVTT